MTRDTIRLMITALLLVTAIMGLAYKLYGGQPQQTPYQESQGEAPAPVNTASQEPEQGWNQPQPGVVELNYTRRIAVIQVGVVKGSSQEATMARTGGEVTPSNMVDVDLGFINSIKHALLERHIKGRVVGLELVDVKGQCIKCALLITIESGGTRTRILVLGSWKVEDDGIVSPLNLMPFISEGDIIEVEALDAGYKYNGENLYIAYEIELKGKDLEAINISLER